MITKIICTTVISLLLFAGSCRANILGDADFEEANLAQWDVVWNEANIVAAAADPVPYAGTAYAKCWYDGGRRQILNIDKTKAYRFSGSFYIPDNGDSNLWAVFFKVAWLDAQGNKLSAFEATVTPTDDMRERWKTFSSAMLMPPQSTTRAYVEFGVWQSQAEPAHPCCFDAFGVTPNSGNAWRIETVDHANSEGAHTSLAMDAGGNPHITYYSGADNDLKYAVYKAGAWKTETVDSAGDVGAFSSLAIDSAGEPHVAYMDNNGWLKYARKQNGVWTSIGVYNTGGAAADPSLALDANGRPHISFYVNYWGILMYARYTGTNWSVEYADLSGYYGQGLVGTFSALAIDAQGNSHVSYYDATNKNLKYAKRTAAGAWTSSVVDSADDTGQYTSIAVDSHGVPHISYYFATGGDLRYASKQGSSWTIESIDVTNNVGHYSSLALDGRDNPHIAYFDFEKSDLKYARRVNGVWQVELIQTAEDVGAFVSLALDSQGDPCFAYQKRSGSYDLMFAATKLPPQPPDDLQAVAGSGKVTLSWNVAVDDDVRGYAVYRSVMPAGPYQAVSGGLTAVSYEDVQVANGTTYYYRVSAQDAGMLESIFSQEVSATPSSSPVAPDAVPGTASSGGGDGGGGGCFIATAAYGTPLAEQVRCLSRFRDHYLLTNAGGVYFTAAYYSVSPSIARHIAGRPSVRVMIRGMLDPLVNLVRFVECSYAAEGGEFTDIRRK